MNHELDFKKAPEHFLKTWALLIKLMVGGAIGVCAILILMAITLL